MTTKDQYRFCHTRAKFIVCFLLVLLVTLEFYFNSIILCNIIVILWIFGVNIVAYVIETVKGWRHNHDKF